MAFPFISYILLLFCPRDSRFFLFHGSHEYESKLRNPWPNLIRFGVSAGYRTMPMACWRLDGEKCGCRDLTSAYLCAERDGVEVHVTLCRLVCLLAYLCWYHSPFTCSSKTGGMPRTTFASRANSWIPSSCHRRRGYCTKYANERIERPRFPVVLFSETQAI